MNIKIRRERREDWQETEYVTREAFWNVYGPGCCEHYLLHVIRGCDALVPELDFVAVDQGKIVGNVICVRARIEGDDGKEREVLTLGPISVLPEYQGRGIGGRLIEEIKKAARRLGFGAILLCGDPAYYGRNGFVAAEILGIRTADNVYMAALQVYELHEGALKGAAGRYFEDSIYGVDEKCVAEFDRSFPEKEKIVGTATQKRFEELVQMMRPADSEMADSKMVESEMVESEMKESETKDGRSL